MTQKDELLQYYNSIVRVDYFKQYLDSDNELYYDKRIKFWIDWRNENLSKNEILNVQKEWLTVFNINLKRVMENLVFLFEKVIEWNEKQVRLHPNDIEIRVNYELQTLKRFVTNLSAIYDNDKLLAYEMQQYCISGFKQMIVFVKEQLLINIEKAPCYGLIQDVIIKYKNVIEFEKVKLSLDNVKLKSEHQETPTNQSQFSVLEWATIFYYANETKLLPENRFIKNRMEQFMKYHKITTTFTSFKSKYHNAKNRINNKNDYPIDKLELILPFLREHYKQVVTKVENDINFLKTEISEY